MIDWRRCIHRFSSLSRCCLASLESGGEGIKLMTVISTPSNMSGFVVGQQVAGTMVTKLQYPVMSS